MRADETSPKTEDVKISLRVKSRERAISDKSGVMANQVKLKSMQEYQSVSTYAKESVLSSVMPSMPSIVWITYKATKNDIHAK